MNEDNQKLAQLLQIELEQTRELLELLNLESDALSEASPASLEKLLENKQLLIRQLETTGSKREEMLASMRNHPAAETCDPLNDQPQLAALWQELLTIAQQCQDKNRQNGCVIELGQKKSQQALDILRGVKSRVDVYNNDGQTSKNARSTRLATA